MVTIQLQDLGASYGQRTIISGVTTTEFVGGQVVAGQASVVQANAQNLIIQQGSPRAVLDWRGFSIGKQETVTFVQPDRSSVALNRVLGGRPSEIYGRLSANGQVFLVNPSGILFGPGASVNVGSLVASTRDTLDSDFMAGRYLFSGQSDAGISNQGTITVPPGGTVALLGRTVNNQGSITTPGGTTALASGDKITLDFQGDGLTTVSIDRATLEGLIDNGGALLADGGQVILTARAATQINLATVNQGGLVRADSLVDRGGRILLDAGSAGSTNLGGTTQANGSLAGTVGGNIQALGQTVKVLDGAQVQASGVAGGGTILLGGDYQGSVANGVPQAQAMDIARTASVSADATVRGDGGRIVAWSTGTTAVHGHLSSRGGPQGGDGGLIETSGRTLDTSQIEVVAAAHPGMGQAGTWLLDPEFMYIVHGLAGGPLNGVTVTDGTLSNVLSSGTSVTLQAEGGAATGNGNIVVDDMGSNPVSIIHSGGSDVTLNLYALGNIIVKGQPPSTIFAAASSTASTAASTGWSMRRGARCPTASRSTPRPSPSTPFPNMPGQPAAATPWGRRSSCFA